MNGREPPALPRIEDPVSPPLPSGVYAALPRAYRIGLEELRSPAPALDGLYADKRRDSVSGQKPVLATLVPHIKTGRGSPAVTVSRLKDNASYNHAANFSWIEGVLEHSPSGEWRLRYGPPLTEDPWTGCVGLENDSRLARFQPGDSVRVEGDFTSVGAEAEDPPVYRCRRISPVH